MAGAGGAKLGDGSGVRRAARLRRRSPPAALARRGAYAGAATCGGRCACCGGDGASHDSR